MKVLFITDNKINGFGGGSIESKKHYLGLKKFCGIKHNLKVISLDKDLPEQMNIKIIKNKIIDIFTRIIGHSSFLYITLLFNKKSILNFNPDIVYLSRSRFGFFAKWLKKKINCLVITNIDNVEYDYIEAYFNNKDKFSFFKKILERKCVKKDEKLTIKYSDKMIFLTQRNIQRYKELYNYKEKESIIIPICIGKNDNNLQDSDFKNIIFIGSLDYASNIYAAKKIIELWKEKYTNNYNVKLIIAGRNPNDELIEQIKDIKNAELISNFKELQLVVPRYSLMLAPIEKGAGMKVKVAESLSLGISVAGSDEALVGYEEALNNELSKKGIYRCNTQEDYIKCIDEYIRKDKMQLKQIEKNQIELFKRYYSYARSDKGIEELIRDFSKRSNYE